MCSENPKKENVCPTCTHDKHKIWEIERIHGYHLMCDRLMY